MRKFSVQLVQQQKGNKGSLLNLKQHIDQEKKRTKTEFYQTLSLETKSIHSHFLDNPDIYENGGSTKSNSSTFTVNSSSSAASAANNFVNNFHLLQQQQLQMQQANGLGNFVSSDSLIQIGQSHYSQQNLNDLTLQSLQHLMQKSNRFVSSNKNATLLKSSRDRQNSISKCQSDVTGVDSTLNGHKDSDESKKIKTPIYLLI